MFRGLPSRCLRKVRGWKGQAGLLFTTMDKLSQIEPPLSEEEIQAEIEAARAERRASSRKS